MNYNKTASRLKGEIILFADRISDGLSKPEKKAVAELLFGILSGGSCLVTEVSRRLDDPVKFKKVLDRLTRHLSKEDFGKRLQLNYLQKVRRHIKKDTLICVDYTTIVKEYAQVQDNLCKVYDNQTKTVETGFWQMEVCAIDSERKKYLPLYSRLYSQQDDKFTSENTETYTTLDILSKSLRKKGIYVFDRGFDRNLIFKKLLELDVKFIVRLKKNRHLGYGKKGRRKNVEKLAESVRCQVSEIVKFKRQGKIITAQMDYGSRQVKLPDFPDVTLNLTVIKNKHGKVRAMFLTNLPGGSRKNLNKVVNGYFLRWSVEEVIRFRKQAFDLENIRLRSWTRLQNMTTLTLLSAGITGLRTCVELPGIVFSQILYFAKRVGGIKRFSLYAIRDGMSFLLNSVMLRRKHPQKHDSNQLNLFKIDSFSRIQPS